MTIKLQDNKQYDSKKEMSTPPQKKIKLMKSSDLRRTSGLMTFDNVLESRAVESISSQVAAPQTPFTVRGSLQVTPSVSGAASTFDTIFHDEEDRLQSSSSDDCIPPTPPRKKN